MSAIPKSPISPTDAEQLVSRAQALVPTLRERAERIAQTRSMPEDVIRDLNDAGLRGLQRPRRFGGPEHPCDVLYRVGRELAKGDGSTAWVYLVTGATDVMIGLFPASVQEEYWTSSRPCGASSYMPTGKAVPVAGGFRLSGKWSYCSGIDQAGWVMLGGIVGMLDNPPRPDMRYFLVPDRDFTIVDDWHVMGLRGTGSKSIVVEDCFVPLERIITFDQIVAGDPANENVTYRQSGWMIVSYCIAGPATGIAQTMFELILAEARGRSERHDPLFEARRPIIQSELAEAAALIDCSEMLYTRSLETAFAKVKTGVRLTDAERTRNRRDQAYSALLARKAGELLMAMAGGRGTSESHPVQRAFRDLYTIAVHPGANWDTPSLSYGSVLLGGRPTEIML
jgi:alkylation response protein AidB-like acyl-CoA dehydrogenase